MAPERNHGRGRTMKTAKRVAGAAGILALAGVCLMLFGWRDGEDSRHIPERVTLNMNSSGLSVHGQVTLTPTFSSAAAERKKTVWSTDRPEVLGLRENGDGTVTITALKEGSALVSIEALDRSMSAACRVTVTGDDDRVVRILGIGNSFTEDVLDSHLHELAAAVGAKAIVAHLTIGGATLEEHAHNATSNTASYRYVKKDSAGTVAVAGGRRIADAVREEEWDFICFQQQSWLAGQFDSYETALPELVAYVKGISRNPDTTYALLQTWAFGPGYPFDDYDHYDNDQMTMYAALVDAAERASALVTPKMLVIPAGTAIQNGRKGGIGDVFCRDGFHLDFAIGRFTVACAWYEAAFEGNIVDNPHVPEGMPDEHAAIAKRAASRAVAAPDRVSEMGGNF